MSACSLDGGLGGSDPSDTSISTQHAVKTYADTKNPRIRMWSVIHSLSQGTGAGDTVSGAWTTLPLTSIEISTAVGLTLDSNQLTFGPGNYQINLRKIYLAPIFRVRIYDVGGAVARAYSLSVQQAAGVCGYADINTMLSLPTGGVMEFQYWAGTVEADGLGSPSNIAGVPEIYCRIIILGCCVEV
jgi:hypothetical protein